MNYLRNVERVPREFLGLLEGHYLDAEFPWGKLSQCYSIVQVTCSVVWVGAGELSSCCWRQVLDTLVSLQTATGKVIYQLRIGRIFYNYFKIIFHKRKDRNSNCPLRYFVNITDWNLNWRHLISFRNCNLFHCCDVQCARKTLKWN